MKKLKTIGVLGGMGPFATAYFYNCLLNEAHMQLQAVQDGEYPHIIINSLSLRGSTERGVANSKQIYRQLEEGVWQLIKAGADFVTIPCNSSHSMLTDLRQSSIVPVLSIINATLQQVKRDNAKEVLLLASEDAYNSNLWNIEKIQTRFYIPNDEDKKIITGIVLDVMGGCVSQSNKKLMVRMIDRYQKTHNIDAVIMGCTELPLAIAKKDIDIKLYDSSYLLAKETIAYLLQ